MKAVLIDPDRHSKEIIEVDDDGASWREAVGAERLGHMTIRLAEPGMLALFDDDGQAKGLTKFRLHSKPYEQYITIPGRVLVVAYDPEIEGRYIDFDAALLRKVLTGFDPLRKK